ncbi:MAG: Serine/threonine-protein kinase PrkC [bacterium ADurb.Bin363]|nr:MAG: Serine/threonine-protein kinase PrkC [bacterium ADurb.Bin363]
MTLYCKLCGTKNNDTDKYCSYCGEEIAGGSTLLSSSLSPDSIIGGRYTILSLIKAGGMGAVYKATDGRLDRICAVKELFSDYDNSEEQEYAIKRFNTEAKILSNLQHDHLPVVYDYFIENGRYYLVMSFIEGEDLDTILEREGTPFLTEDKVVEWAQQILTVLDYLHNQSPPIIYRDIKPANIMIRVDGRAMLVDFGIARVVNPEQKVSKTSIGTDGYAPKEQYKGQVEPRSDIYALGATMHHLLTGEVPVPLDFEPVSFFNPGISTNLEQIIMRALEREVYNRFADAKAMLEALQNYNVVIPKEQNVSDDVFDLQIDEEGTTSDEFYDLDLDDEMTSGPLTPLEEEDDDDQAVPGLLEWTGEKDTITQIREEEKKESLKPKEKFDQTALEEFSRDFKRITEAARLQGKTSSEKGLEEFTEDLQVKEEANEPEVEEDFEGLEEEEYEESDEEAFDDLSIEEESDEETFDDLSIEEESDEEAFDDLSIEEQDEAMQMEEEELEKELQEEVKKKEKEVLKEPEKTSEETPLEEETEEVLKEPEKTSEETPLEEETEEVMEEEEVIPSQKEDLRERLPDKEVEEIKTDEMVDEVEGTSEEEQDGDGEDEQKKYKIELRERKLQAIIPPPKRKKKIRAEDIINKPKEKIIKPPKSFESILKPFGPKLPSSIIHPKDDAEMIHIPSGVFMMGSDDSEDDNPKTRVYLYSYYIDKYPVTNFRYNIFLQETNYTEPEDWNYSPQTAEHPVIGIDWEDARAYADWSGKRLPTEAEWEKAARGTDERIYPWGNEWDKYKCNNWNMDDPDIVEKMLDIENERGTTPVGCFSSGVSPYGLMDIAGNVSEWCSDTYKSPLVSGTLKKREEEKDIKICRGGSWRGVLINYFKVCHRRKSVYYETFDDVGFRCCQTPRHL